MALLTINHYINQANNFINNVRDTKHSYYVFAGRTYAWPNDSSPPAANNSVTQYQQTVYDDLLFGKLVKSTDVINMAPRYNWTTNTVYAQYDQADSDLYSKQFYVVTDQYNVYKCIFNNYGANSTVKPTLTTPSGSFSTADGYVWKYMYTIDSVSNTKFTTSSYVPVIQNSNVQSNSIPGTIEAIQLSNTGTGYNVYEKGNIVKFVDAFTIQLPNTSSAVDNYYALSSIYLKAGFGSGQIRQITSSSGSAKTVRVNSATPLNVFDRLDLSSVSGTVGVGSTAQQNIDYIAFSYGQGYFTVGDVVAQVNSGASGTVLAANSSTIQVARVSTTTPFALNYPIVDTSYVATLPVLQPGTVNIVAGVNTVISTNSSQTQFTTAFPVGSYIRVGSSANSNVRRVTAVNTSTVNVDITFDTTLVSNVHYTVPAAAEPSTITTSQATGSVTNTNLTSLNLSISSPSTPGQYFTLGEIVDLVNSANTIQNANAIVAFANTSTVFLTAVNGTNWTNPSYWASNYYVRGESSQIRYLLNSATTNPNITINNITGSFVLGQKVYFTSTSGAATGNASLVGTTLLPNDSTEYEIGPTISIVGDGTNAAAIAVVNTATGSANSISYIEMINPGRGYTFANVTVVANSNYGTGAVANALISPVYGHGYDVMTELGARYVGINTTFDTGPNESYYFPTYSTYRRIGLLEDPAFADVRVTLTSFDRVNLTISNPLPLSGPWTPGEVVVQSTSNAAGVVVTGNSTALQLKSVKGTFASNPTYTLRGYYSGTTANTTTANVIYFVPGTTAEVVSEVTSGAQATVTLAYSNTLLQLSNVVGQFANGDTLYDGSSNAYATVSAISVANGSKDQTSSFANKFNQTARITLTTSTGTFANNEYVQQSTTSANGRIVSMSNDIDLLLSGMSGTFANGQTVTDQTSLANGVVIFANTTYVKLTAVSQTLSFTTGHVINNGSSSTATISQILPVLILNDVNGPNRFQAQPNNIVGQTSGAVGQCNSYSLITYPELVRESGKVVYMENIQPVQRTQINKEEFKLVIRF